MFCEMNTNYFTSLICEFYFLFLEFISLYIVVTSTLAYDEHINILLFI